MSYFDYFEKQFFDGDGFHKFFTKDRSSEKPPQRELTKEEKKERREWKGTLTKLRNHYKNKAVPEVKTTEDLMEILMLPPRLEDQGSVSSRTGDKEPRIRLYPAPKNIKTWSGFHEKVCSHSPPKTKLDGKNSIGDIFRQALFRSEKKSYSSERGEEIGSIFGGYLGRQQHHPRNQV